MSMDVFGYGTDEPSRPLLPPGLCWICSNSPQQEAMKVIDTRRNSRPEKRGQSERIYVCEPCAKELGAAVGQVSAEEHQVLNIRAAEMDMFIDALKSELAQAKTQQNRVVDISEISGAIRAELTELRALQGVNIMGKKVDAVPPASTDE